MNKRDKKLWVLGIVIVCVFVTTIAYKVFNNNDIKYSKPLFDQQNLFTLKAQEKLRFVLAVKTDNSQPSSVYVYDDKYTITVYKASLQKSLNLKDIIHFEIKESQRIDGFYTSGGNPDFSIKFAEERKDSLSKLNFRYQGDYIDQNFKNDNLYYGYMKFDNYSLAYDGGCFLSATVKFGKESSPASIMVLKRNNYIYIINMTMFSDGDYMPQSLLYEMIRT